MKQFATRLRWSCGVGLVLGLASSAAVSASQSAACSGVADCRAQTEAAIAQGDFERAHDLAWRAIPQGPRNDRGLMLLLARTQALSGRPDDALVMIRRIAETGAMVDVSAGEFARMRELPGWPAVESLLARAAAPPAAPPTASVAPKAPVASVAPPAPLAPVAPAVPKVPKVPVVPATIEEAGRFVSSVFAPGGLACDAVSKRFVFGDRPGRKLLIVAEGSDHSIDLTRADVAGFLDVLALDIDTTNGNLWVASAAADGTGAALHRLQLISGRALASYAMPGDTAAVQPVDVAVTRASGVLVLDAAQRRVLVLRPGASALAVLADLGETQPASLTVGRQDGVAYVAHRDGLASVDLRTRKVSPLTGPKGMVLGGIERLRRSGAGLVGMQTLPDGSRRLVRLTLDAAGRNVTRLRMVDVVLSAGDAAMPMTVCGDTVAFLAGEAVGPADSPSTAWSIRRVRLNP